MVRASFPILKKNDLQRTNYLPPRKKEYHNSNVNYQQCFLEKTNALPQHTHTSPPPPTDIFSFSTAETLKIRTGTPKSKQFFVMIMTQLYIHENLIRIQPLVYKILCRQESFALLSTLPTPNAYGICTKINMYPSPQVW